LYGILSGVGSGTRQPADREKHFASLGLGNAAAGRSREAFCFSQAREGGSRLIERSILLLSGAEKRLPADREKHFASLGRGKAAAG
jgi:hypothetical protein